MIGAVRFLGDFLANVDFGREADDGALDLILLEICDRFVDI